MNSKTEVSAGGVVYKKENDTTFWLIAKHSGYHQWGLPKGLVEKDEELEATALREVQEETGIKAKIIQQIPEPESYVYSHNGKRIFKTVHYFLMEYVTGNIEDHDWETEEVLWVDFDRAKFLLHYEGAKTTLQKAYDILIQF